MFQIDTPIENEADVTSDANNPESSFPEKGFKGEWKKEQKVENYTVKLVLIDLTLILRMKLAYQFLSRFTFLVFVSLVVRGSSKKKEKETRRNDSLDSNQNRIWNNTTANILSKYSLSDKILIRSIVSINRSFNRIHDWLANLCKKIW